MPTSSPNRPWMASIDASSRRRCGTASRRWAHRVVAILAAHSHGREQRHPHCEHDAGARGERLSELGGRRHAGRPGLREAAGDDRRDQSEQHHCQDVARAQGGDPDQIRAQVWRSSVGLLPEGVVRLRNVSSRSGLTACISWITTSWSNASWPMTSGRVPPTVRTPSPSRLTSKPDASSAAARTSGRRAPDADGRHLGDVEELGEWLVSDQSAAIEHHDVLDGLRHLCEHVAGEQDGPALVGQTAEEVAQPADPLRVQAVRRLVEHQHPGIADQGGGEPEALLHPE